MKLAKMTAALAVAGLALPALAAGSETATLQKLLERMEKLEARNAELEKEVKALKGESESIAKGLESPRLSEYEPELTVRLKGAEKDVLEMKKSAKLADKLDGIKVGAALTTVGQHASGLPNGTTDGGSQLNYRADVTVELPLNAIGDIEHKVFAHVRMGQGQGLNAPLSNLGHFASAPNAVAFRASGANPDDSVAILGQAWYQAAIPLPFGGFKPYSREKLELTFGKMDIFEGQFQGFPRVWLEAAKGQRNRRLIPGLAEDGDRVVRVGTAGAEGNGIGGAGEVAETGKGRIQTLALTHANMGKDLVFDIADGLQRQFNGDVGAVIELAASVGCPLRQAGGVLGNGGQRRADLDAVELVGERGGFLHFQRVFFDRLQAHRQFRLVLRKARAVETLGDFLAFTLQRFNLLLQFGVARFQLFHALDQFLQGGSVGGGDDGQRQPRRDQRGSQFGQLHDQ